MSKERFWCLLSGDPEVFGVNSEIECDVEELAKTIRHEKSVLSDVVLMKLKEPIPVDPEETLLQRLPTTTDSFVKLRRTEQVSDALPNRPKRHLLIYVTLRDTKRRIPDSPFDTDGNKQKRQKDTEVLRQMKALYERICLLSEESKKYSDPNEVFDLPFPSLNQAPERFSLRNQQLSYMGRECFSQIWQTFGFVKNDPDHRQAIYLFGVKGLGKSHILVALVCLLVRHGTQVVYIPDCLAWLLEPRTYLQNALVFAFINSDPSLCEELLDCKDDESLVKVCERYPNPLCFVVDQVNALDHESNGEDVTPDKKKDILRDFLHRMCARNILITSASANHKTFQHMQNRMTGEKKISLMGMTSVEMACWWKYHGFTSFSDEEKQRVEDLTGCIPLLLNPFLMRRDKTLESLEPQIWMDEVLNCVNKETIDFANAQKFKNRTYYDEYVSLMRNCLLGRYVGGSGQLLDHRYFYLDADSCARYSCGLARQAIMEFLQRFKNNPSVIGFTVEQILISKMASAGLRGSIILPGAKIIPFEAIDLLFDEINLRKKIAYLVGIQITVAKQHKDSEAAFFNELETWRAGLKQDIEHFEISFVWIHEGQRGRFEVEKKLRVLRGKTVEISPDYATHWVSVEQVDADLERTLRRIRPN